MHVALSKMYVDDRIRQAVVEVLNSGQYIKGQKLRDFEHEFADFCSTEYLRKRAFKLAFTIQYLFTDSLALKPTSTYL